MTVQTIKRKIDETRDGLQAIENDLMHADLGHRVTAVVTYELVEHRDNLDTGGSPVIKAIATEPITTPDALEQLTALMTSAYQVRTGATALDLPDVEGEEA